MYIYIYYLYAWPGALARSLPHNLIHVPIYAHTPHKKKHANTTQQVNAVVTVKEGASLTEQDVLDHCRKSLSDFKLPKKLFIAATVRSFFGVFCGVGMFMCAYTYIYSNNTRGAAHQWTPNPYYNKRNKRHHTSTPHLTLNPPQTEYAELIRCRAPRRARSSGASWRSIS